MKGTLESAGTAHFKPGEFPVSQVIVACEPALLFSMGRRESGKKDWSPVSSLVFQAAVSRSLTG